MAAIFNASTINDFFHQKVLDDLRLHSYFVVVKVETPNYKGRIAIENDDLLIFLHVTKGINQKKYKAFVNELLKNHIPLKLSDEELEKWKLKRIKPIDEVNDYASKGQEKFIEYYFNERVIKKDLSEEEQLAIIAKLFDWQIATNIDDITGNLVFTRFDRSKNICSPKKQ